MILKFMLALASRQSHPYWMHFRQHSGYVSSTQFAAVLGCSSFKSPMSLWRKKNGKMTATEKKNSTFQSHAMKIGIDYENDTLQECISALNIKYPVKKPGIIYDLEKGPFSCSPDGMFVNKETDSLVGIEVKTPQKEVPAFAEDIKPDYLLQCFTSLHITQAEHWILFYKAFLTGETACFIIGRNEQVWNRIKKQTTQFLELKTEPPRRTKITKRVTDEILEDILLGVTWVQMP